MGKEKFEDLGEQLEKVKTIDDLLEIIFNDYLSTYYQDPPPGRKEFIEKLMDKIHEFSKKEMIPIHLILTVQNNGDKP